MNLYYPFLDDIQENENMESIYKKKVLKYKQAKSNFKNGNLKFLDVFSRESLSKNDIVDEIKETIETLMYLSVKPSDMVFGFYNDNKKKTFTKIELDNLKKLERHFFANGVKIGIYDYQDVYGYEQVKNTNNIIKSIAAHIKKSNLSTLEQLLYAYQIVKRRVYTESANDVSYSKSRSVFGVTNGNDIVCAGYSELLSAIIGEIDNEGLKSFQNLVGTTDSNEEKFEDKYSTHQTNIVYIEDKKYRIKGFYYLDPTWDSYSEEYGCSELQHFLLSLSQIKLFKDESIQDFWKQCEKIISETKKKDKCNNRSKKNKTNNYINTGVPRYDSVSKNEISWGYNSLLDFLLEKPDFVDYVILKQTIKDMKNKDELFDKYLLKNYKKATKRPEKLKVLNDSKEMWEYLAEHSPYVDLGPIQEALVNVYKTMYPKKNKDEIAKMVHDDIKINIDNSTQYFEQNAKTPFIECNEMEK